MGIGKNTDAIDQDNLEIGLDIQIPKLSSAHGRNSLWRNKFTVNKSSSGSEALDVPELNGAVMAL